MKVERGGRYLGGLARGDFGPSFQYKDFTVTELIASGFPVSLRLGGLAMLSFLVSGAFAVERVRVERQATDAERPDPSASQARGDLQLIYNEMSDYAVQLNPLSEHLQRPTVGWILKDIAGNISKLLSAGTSPGRSGRIRISAVLVVGSSAGTTAAGARAVLNNILND